MNNHRHLENLLRNYASIWLEQRPAYPRALQWIPEEQQTFLAFQAFATSGKAVFDRQLLEGHVTASTYIIDASCENVLLHHHKKLGKWLQLGGHCDSDPRTDLVALREAREESGLVDFRFPECSLTGTQEFPIPIDLDVHDIPETPYEPAHKHYDVRFALIAANPNKIRVSDESLALKWFPLTEAYLLNPETSMQRPFDKLKLIGELLL